MILSLLVHVGVSLFLAMSFLGLFLAACDWRAARLREADRRLGRLDIREAQRRDRQGWP